MQKVFTVGLTEQQVRTIAWAVNRVVDDATVSLILSDYVSEIEIPEDLLGSHPTTNHYFVTTGTRVDSKCAVCKKGRSHQSHRTRSSLYNLSA